MPAARSQSFHHREHRGTQGYCAGLVRTACVPTFPIVRFFLIFGLLAASNRFPFFHHRGRRGAQRNCVGPLKVGCVCASVIAYFFFLILGLLAPVSLRAQETRSHPTSSVRHGTPAPAPASGIAADANLRAVVRKSGLIFDGVVTGVARETGAAGVPLAYRISFQVKQGLLGVRSGSVVTVREWAGLWANRDTHEPRYRIGERSVLFFYPQRAGGLTSPVGGDGGKLAVRGELVVLPVEWVLKGAGSAATVARFNSRSNRISLRLLVQQIRLAGGE